MSDYHVPVMLNEAIEGLAIKPDGVYVDATFGGGGHAKAILHQLNNKGKLYAFDRDEDAQANLPHDERLTFIAHNFKHVARFLRLHNVLKIDGIIADLGVSWHQFNTPERGFSFRFAESFADMRMDKSDALTAAEILRKYDINRLAHIFKTYGELPGAYNLAAEVVKVRAIAPMQTVEELMRIAEPFVRGKRNQFFAQLFQALRMEVNDEVGALEELLRQSAQLLPEGGRLVVISYHSIEDRLVKNYIKKGTFDGSDLKDLFGNSLKPFKAVNRKVMVPSETEIAQNPKSRSAKLRIAERI